MYKIKFWLTTKNPKSANSSLFFKEGFLRVLSLWEARYVATYELKLLRISLIK